MEEDDDKKQRIQVPVRTRRIFVCPVCNQGTFNIEHLYAGTVSGRFGPWYCDNPHCEAVINGIAPKEGQEHIEVTISKRKKPRGLGLLFFKGVYLIIEERFGSFEDNEHADYSYHAHRCPQNIFRDVIAVFDAEEKDPHGLLHYVASVEDNMHTRKVLDQANTWEDLFELFKTDGTPRESDYALEWPETGDKE